MSWNVYYWCSFTPIKNSKSLAKTRILSTGVKEMGQESPRLSVLAPIELCIKWYGMHQYFLSRSLYSVYMYGRGTLCHGGLPVLYIGISELILKKNRQKLLTLHSPFCIFSHKNTLTKLPSWVLWSLLLKPLDALQNGHSNKKNAKSGVRQFQVCYLGTTYSSTLKDG